MYKELKKILDNTKCHFCEGYGYKPDRGGWNCLHCGGTGFYIYYFDEMVETIHRKLSTG